MERFRSAERPGSYARVLEPREVAAGDAVELLPLAAGLTLLDHFRLYYDRAPSVERIERALAAPISVRERTSLEKRLSGHA